MLSEHLHVEQNAMSQWTSIPVHRYMFAPLQWRNFFGRWLAQARSPNQLAFLTPPFLGYFFANPASVTPRNGDIL